MPTYQYECTACGHEFEELQSMTEAKLKKCPQCGKKKLARLIGSGAGMIFKGSGFYATDYKKKPASPQPAGTGGPVPPETKTESKPSTAASPAKSTGPCGSGCGCHS